MHLEMSSRFVNIEVAERALVDCVERAGFAGDVSDGPLNALREAVANAIRHGNREESHRRVVVDLSIHNEELSIRVEDEGEGFDIDAVPDPTAPENLLRPCGRGIFYMRQFMNRVEYSCAPGGGTVVTLSQRLDLETRS
ncbi:MAG: ATP-binding protein [Thermoanaerobaculales bacterium]|nr:ATP-binding protein [Thermoanaerobaculales bacterium]